MKRAALVVLAVTMFAAPAQAGFSDLASALESRIGKRMWIPMFGLARTLVRIVHPRGVHDLQLAVFEDAKRLDGREAEQLFLRHAGPGFTPLVRVRSRHETVLVFAKPLRDDRVELMVLNQDRSDTVLVRVRVAADVMTRHLRDGKQFSRMARR